MYPEGYVNTNTTWEEWAKAHPEIVNKKRKVILRQGQSPGDLLMMSRAVGDLKDCYPNYEIDLRTPCFEIWENNPRLTKLNEGDSGVEVFDINYDEIQISGWNGLHFSDSFRHDIEKKLGVPVKKTGIKPELWISDEEKSWWNQAHCEFGWDGPFWVINAGRKPDNELKQYHRYQEVVDLFNDYFKGRIKLIQIGHKDHIHPKLNGVLDFVGKTNIRELIRLCYWAQGTIGPISLQMVISAALNQPSVCVFGGKEGIRWQKYPHIKYLDTIGYLKCCEWDGCWLGGVKGKCKDLVDYKDEKIPRCFAMIKPYMVFDAIKGYYDGGRLKIPNDEENNKFQRAFEDFQKSKKGK